MKTRKLFQYSALCFAVAFAMLAGQAKAQCTITSTNSPVRICGGGMAQFSAGSYQTGVNHHVWYDAPVNGTGYAPTREYSPMAGVWVSEWEIQVSGPRSYWVEPQCSSGASGPRVEVRVEIVSGTLSIVMSPNKDKLNLCEGESVTLSASATDLGSNPYFTWTDGTHYWYGSSIHPTTSGIYKVSSTDACNRPLTSSDVELKFKPTLQNFTVSDLPDFCQGQGATHQYDAWPLNPTPYYWSITGAGNSIDSNTGLVTWSPAFTGTATVSATASGGCNGSVSASSDVIIKPNPLVHIVADGPLQLTFDDPSITLTNDAAFAGTHQWYRGNTLIKTSPGKSIALFDAGEYFLKATENACVSESNHITITSAPENNHNYIITNLLQQEAKQDGTAFAAEEVRALPIESRVQKIEYFDGLGRPEQTVITQGSPGHKDIVTPMAYDNLGRMADTYLPYVSGQANGSYKDNPLGTAGNYASSDQYMFYNQAQVAIAQDLPKATTLFEPSPLNRAVKQGAPGQTWQPLPDANDYGDKSIKTSYLSNEQEEVLLFSYDAVEDQLTYSYYKQPSLFKNKTTDENNHEVIEYKDTRGTVVCRKVETGTVNGEKQYASTYYVYDDMKQLIMVLPPEAIVEILKQQH